MTQIVILTKAVLFIKSFFHSHLQPGFLDPEALQSDWSSFLTNLLFNGDESDDNPGIVSSDLTCPSEV